MSIFMLFKKKNDKGTETKPQPWAAMKNPTENLNSFLSNAVNESAMEPPKTSPVPYHHEDSFSTSVQYYLDDSLLEFIGNMDREVEKFVASNNLDEYNVNFWKERISNMIDLAVSKLELQRAKHESVIRDLKIYKSVELTKLEGELSYLEKELQEKEAYLALLMETKP